MGQRHQIYLIARVQPHGDPQGRSYYRCIGGFHHQYCYGELPPRAVRRFIDLVQNKHNARIIREEIHAIQGKYGRSKEEPTIPRLPCPYSTFLVASAITTDIEDPVEPYITSQVTFHGWDLPADMGSTEGDNNEGITIIDITDPEKPSYCFVSIDGLDSSVHHYFEGTYHDNTPIMIPLSAAEYVRAYHPLPDADLDTHVYSGSEDTVLEAIAMLDGVPLVTPKMLFEAWPSEYRECPDDQLEESSDSEDRLEESKMIVRSVVTSVPSLIQLIIRPAVERGLEADEMTGIENIIWMASNAEMIKEFKTIMLLQDPFPETAIGLLTKIVCTEVDADKVINLSGFHLSPEQIITLLTSKQFGDAEVLDLSNMPGLTIDTIIKVLPSLPNLRRLVLLGTSITDDEICELLPKQAMLFRYLEALIHPCFIKYVEGSNRYPNAFSIISRARQNYFTSVASIPYFTPAQALQAVTDYISSFSLRKIEYLRTSPIAAQAAIASEVRHPGQKWSQRSVPLLPQHSLRAFKGEGWFFAFKLIPCSDRYSYSGDLRPRHRCSYAFVKLDPDSNFVKSKLEADENSNPEDWGALKVCNLHEFLSNMQDENRPLPPSSTVDNLTYTMEKLRVNVVDLRLMTAGEAINFITEIACSDYVKYDNLMA